MQRYTLEDASTMTDSDHAVEQTRYSAYCRLKVSNYKLFGFKQNMLRRFVANEMTSALEQNREMRARLAQDSIVTLRSSNVRCMAKMGAA